MACSYLENQMQQSLNVSLSESRLLRFDIPYGYAGLLSFLLYINDLQNCLSNSEPWLYADHTHLTFVDKDIYSIQAFLNRDLSAINQWLIANKLTY